MEELEMSIAGITASSFFSSAIAPGAHNKVKQAQKDLQRGDEIRFIRIDLDPSDQRSGVA
jgi:hypothetical protein